MIDTSTWNLLVPGLLLLFFLVILMARGFGVIKLEWLNIKSMREMRKIKQETDDPFQEEALKAILEHCKSLNSKRSLIFNSFFYQGVLKPNKPFAFQTPWAKTDPRRICRKTDYWTLVPRLESRRIVLWRKRFPARLQVPTGRRGLLENHNICPFW